MKYLKINDNKGFYQTGDDNWKEIDSINKEDLMILLDKAIETDFEMNEFIVDNIQNKARNGSFVKPVKCCQLWCTAMRKKTLTRLR